MMYEGAKMSKKQIYTAYSDFKGVFGGMYHRILFKTMRELRFPECDINTCEKLYKVTGTYYMISHGNTPHHTHTQRHTTRGHPIAVPIHDIHGATTNVALHKQHRLYTHTQTELPASTHMTYDDHGYADDINTTTDTLEKSQHKIRNYISSTHTQG